MSTNLYICIGYIRTTKIIFIAEMYMHHDAYLRVIKVVDIGYMTALYMILGVLVARLFDWYYGDFDEDRHRRNHLGWCFLEIAWVAWCVGVSTYILRNTVPYIPFPFQHVYQYDHMKLKELTMTGIFVMMFLQMCRYFKLLLTHTYNRMS